MSIYNLMAEEPPATKSMYDLTDAEKIDLLKHNLKLKQIVIDYIANNNYIDNIANITDELVNEIFVDEWQKILEAYAEENCCEFIVDENFNILKFSTELILKGDELK